MGTASSTAVIGRTRDLDLLADAFTQAAAGSPRTVLIGGEAGIGKTRLLTEFAARVAASDGLALVGACLDLADGGLPFLPLAEVLRQLTRTLPKPEVDQVIGPARRELARLVPELASSRSVDAATDDALAPGRLFEIVLGVLGRLSARAPTVIAFEDVHWIDRASRDLASFLARNLTTERLMLLITFRSDDLPRGGEIAAWLSGLDRSARVSRLELERLQASDVVLQMEAITGKRPSAQDAAQVWERSDGNPYFVEELTAGGALDSVSPSSLVEILTARLQVLSVEGRDLVRAMAVGGRSIDETLLAEVTGQPVDAVRARLREAVERRILEPDADEGGRLRFRHALVREVAAAELLAGERRALHERFATTLASRSDLADPSPAGAAAELAHHWEAAGRHNEAYAAALNAGEMAASVAAYGEALRQYLRALDLVDRLGEPVSVAERISVLRRASDAADLAGDMNRATSLAKTALALAESIADAELSGLLHSRLGYLHWVLGDGDAALASHRRAVELIPPEPPSAARARALGGLGGSLMGAGQYEESRAVCEDAIRCAVASGATSEEARARNMLGSDLVALGLADEGLRELERSRDMARDAGPPEIVVVSHHNLALNLAQAGRLEQALEVADAGRELARQLGLERRFGMDLAALIADVQLRLGRWDEAETTQAHGFALDPSGRGTIYLSIVGGRLDSLRGNATSAEARFANADRLAAGQIDADLAAYLARGRAELALAAGQPEQALTAAQDGLAVLVGSKERFMRPPLLALGVRAAADLAEGARARRDEPAIGSARRKALPLVEEVRLLQATDGGAATALAALAESELLRLEGRPDAAAWNSAATRLGENALPELAAYARYREAEAELRAQGVRGEAREALASAARLAAGLGAQPLLREIRLLGRRARIELPAEGEPEPGEALTETRAEAPVSVPMAIPLSPREVEVLRLVAAGRSNGQIADELFITRKTVGVHVTHILDKLGVSNRVEAAMAAARLGLVADEP